MLSLAWTNEDGPTPKHTRRRRPSHAHKQGGSTATIIHGTQEPHEALEARLARLAQLNAEVEPISEDSLWHLLGFDVRCFVVDGDWWRLILIG